MAVGEDHPLTYRALRMEGWTLHVNTRILEKHPGELNRATALLKKQLAHINRTVPKPALDQLKEVPLYFNLPYKDGRPVGAAYHPSAGWLSENHRDPGMEKGIEYTNLFIFEEECRRMPVLALHELAHAFHDRVLGFEHPEIVAAFETAKSGGRYELVRNWTGKTFIQKRAYALNNHKEYFAETTEAFFGRNDFQPFDQEELRKLDPGMFELLGRLWGVNPK
jgi:dipeptidyl-peptidase-4